MRRRRHIPAAMLRERRPMRILALALLLIVPAAASRADPVQEARSATSACLSAVINGAPVEDIDGDDVTIRRGKDPVSCTVTVTAGEPVVIRDAVLVALKRRPEIFSPARTAWEPAGLASRETFCNLPGRRAYAAFVSTAKPGLSPVVIATVFEMAKRDDRCDRDMGLQMTAANTETAAPATAAAAVAPTATPAKSKRWRLPHIPGTPRQD
ncbi:hypothetical protein [Phenylobacterium sp.]|uniref:hypothetical protein n=1 Tax=Phenylobacterium sp. TaxID=1871053 RepID=UPI0025F5C827|nr:hypothetical protein [Phenylobacterium sp.]